MIHHGDCLEVMAGMEPESVDAIVTDPPYGLEFMGKEWDSPTKMVGQASWGGRDHGAVATQKGVAHPRGIADVNWPLMQRWHQQWAEAAYRVAKPSAYLLAFGGTRTVHRMTVALEDAGWIIRDMLVWAYLSGFPKSRASLKASYEPIVLARKPGPLRDLDIDGCRIPGEPWKAHEATGLASVKFFTDGDASVLHKEPHDLGRWPANVVMVEPALGDASRVFLIPKADRADREPVLDEYAYRLHRERGECDKLSSWASADLSRNEPTGSTLPARAISDDLPEPARSSSSDTSSPGSPSTDPSPTDIRSTTSTGTSKTTGSRTSSSSIASPISASTPAASSETESGGSPAQSAKSSSGSGLTTGISPLRDGRFTVDADRATSGSSSSRNVCGRCGKPLPRVGSHPTVKPTDLMRHLVRLVTPTGGTVLDPFLGSGSTALAAEMEGFPWIGIEREAEYVAIAEARLNGTQRGLGLEVDAPTPRVPNTHPDLSKHQPKQRASGENWSGRWAGTPAKEETA